jgi:hypothetical protein
MGIDFGGRVHGGGHHHHGPRGRDHDDFLDWLKDKIEDRIDSKEHKLDRINDRISQLLKGGIKPHEREEYRELQEERREIERDIAKLEKRLSKVEKREDIQEAREKLDRINDKIDRLLKGGIKPHERDEYRELQEERREAERELANLQEWHDDDNGCGGPGRGRDHGGWYA